MIRHLACITLALFAINTAILWAGEDDAKAKRADVEKLLELTGSAKMGTMMMKEMLKSFQQTMPDLPAEFWTDIQKEMTGEDLIKLIIPIYEKHFTHDDIKGLIKFYESDVGKRFVDKQGVIVQESMAAGQVWGAKIGEDVMRRIQARKKGQ